MINFNLFVDYFLKKIYNVYGDGMKKRRLKKSVSNTIIGFFFVSTLIIMIFCIIKIIMWSIDNKKTSEITDKINEKITVTTTSEEVIDIINEDVKEDDPIWSYDSTRVKNVDLSKLYEINNETSGWIIVDNTNVNYPVVKHGDNDFYLNHSFDKKKNGAGWVFMDYRNNTGYFDKNTIIYAHGRQDKTMFGSLTKTLKENWYTNPDNYTINFSTENYNSLWQIFSIYKIPTTNDYIQIDFNDNEFDEFLNTITARSIYDFKTTVSSSDKILTLSTCYNDDEKLVIHAKIIKIQNKTGE